jgi:uncharacterized protein YkwD
MTKVLRHGLAAILTCGLMLAAIIAAAWTPGSGSSAAGRAQTQSSQGSSSGWHHFGENKGSWSSARFSDPFAGAEREMYELINRDRAGDRGPAGQPLTPLRWNDQLAAVARAHSRDMVARGYFGHVDRDGRSPGARVMAAGLAWQAVGENIAMDTSVKSAESAFMNEPPGAQNHRSNILSPKFTEVGVGIVAGPDGQLYITQDFMKPAASMKDAFPR